MANASKSTKSKSKAKAVEKASEPVSKSRPKIPGAFRLLEASLGFLKGNWKVFLGITSIYALFSFLLIRGFKAIITLGDIKEALDQVFTTGLEQLVGSFAIFSYLVGSSGTASSSTGGVYQVILLIIFSLAIIWTLRQLYAGRSVRVRDGFYQGMNSIIQFMLVVFVIIVQLLPLALGVLAYSKVVANGIASTVVEQIAWGGLTLALTSISLYLVCSSLFAAYIVTLPNMTPMTALRTGRRLAKGRRWILLRKILFLPLALLVIAAVIVIPLILFATPLAAWAFYVMSIFALPVAHSYMYSLYRSML